MLEIKKVLITTDFSDAARPAMFRGVDLAKQFGAEIHLLHVVLMAESAPVYPMFSVPADTEKVYRELTAASEQRLRAEAAGLPIGRDQIQLVIEHGNFAAPVILDYATRNGVDLIATGTHGRRGFRHLLLGSVAEEVVRKADCAVMTCRPDVSAQPMSPESILAAVDLSEHSTAVVRHARELAAIYKCRIDFVHVIPEPRFPVYFEVGTSMLWAGDAAEVETAARRSLEELVGEVEAPKADSACHVIRGIPDQELVRWAKEKSSDLMVLASHGLTGIGHLLLGSTADKVVRQARCPVITLHASVSEQGGEGGGNDE